MFSPRIVAVAVAGIVFAIVSITGIPAASAATPPPVSSSPAPSYSVTIAARVCPEYTDVMANRARNDIQESLKDLGPDTVYTNGQPVDPSIETPNNPNCTALNGAVFSFGDGINKPSPTDYSVVTVSNPASAATTTPTVNGVPLLNDEGTPTGSTIDGATTYTLNSTQLALAQRGNSLWVQGGTPAAPLPPKGAAGDSYAFAALRCAIDNLNGDNVEWVGFPSTSTGAARHVFCYAYYIDIAPPQGSITIVKQLATGSGAISQTFTFASNATYNPSGTFDLSVNNGQPAQTTFVRATSASFGGPYTFTEQTVDLAANGWTLASLTCTGGSAVGIDLPTATVSVDLQEGEAVVCTYVDRPPAEQGLTVHKVTTGGVGTFPITVVGPGPTTYNLSATTTAENEPVKATGLPANVPAGPYTITETLPADTAAGTWSNTQAYCTLAIVVPARGLANGQQTASITVVLPPGGSADCTFVNTFTPNGTIALHLITNLGTSTASFVATPQPVQPGGAAAVSSETRYKQVATTVTPGVSAMATPLTPADSTEALPLLTYSLTSSPPAATSAGTWSFVSFDCAVGTPTRGDDGELQVTLSAAEPLADCTAVYTLVPAATLAVIKTVTDPDGARIGDAYIEVSCESGSFGRVVAPVGQPGPFQLPAPGALDVITPTTCSVSEPANGAAPGAIFTATASLTGPAGTTVVAVPGTFSVSQPAAAYTLTVSDSYLAGSSGAGGGSGGGSESGAGSGDALPDTGPSYLGREIGLALLLLLSGAGLLGYTRWRSRV